MGSKMSSSPTKSRYSYQECEGSTSMFTTYTNASTVAIPHTMYQAYLGFASLRLQRLLYTTTDLEHNRTIIDCIGACACVRTEGTNYCG